MISDSDRSEGRAIPIRVSYTQADIADVQRRAVAAYKVELAEKVRALPRLTEHTVPVPNRNLSINVVLADYLERAVVLALIDPAPSEGGEG